DPTEPQESGARYLEPEPERRLVDRHEPRRVERGEEEIVPAREHALDARGVVEVAITLLIQAEARERRGERHETGEHAVLPPPVPPGMTERGEVKTARGRTEREGSDPHWLHLASEKIPLSP